MMRADPYLFFNGRSAEAFEFYQGVLGAEVRTLVHFRDIPGGPPGMGDKIMHAELRIGESVLLASDGPAEGAAKFSGFSISLQVDKDTEADRLFAALAQGGTIEVPMMTTPFASRFGKVADRFGVSWMIVNQSRPAS